MQRRCDGDLKDGLMKLYVDVIVKILAKTLHDAFAEIRIESCRCIKTLAVTFSKDFLSQSDPIIDALLATFTHNQARVRAAHTEAMGYALQYGNYRRITDVWRSVAQRVIDAHHTVRRAAFNTLHLWMTQFPDRYSHWNRFIPLFICGLFDVIAEVRAECDVLWRDIGQQYEAENHDEVQQAAELDFDRSAETGGNFPSNFTENSSAERPLLGCRLLVQRVLFNVIQSNLNDLKDWQESVRLQAIKLLQQLLRHAEVSSVVVIDKVLAALPTAARDENRDVVLETKQCAILIGRFIEPKVFCKLLLPSLDSASHLVVLSGILAGAGADLLKDYLMGTLSALKALTLTTSEAQHFYILECIERLMQKMPVQLIEYTNLAYSLLMHINALTESKEMKAKIAEMVEQLKKHQYTDSNADFCSKLCRSFHTELLSCPALAGDWSFCSMEFRILQNYLEEHGITVLHQNSDLLFPAFIANTAPSKSVRVRFGIFQLLLNIIQDTRNQPPADGDWNSQHSESMVRELFAPNMTWKPGRAESVLRAACCSCLVVCVEQGLLSIALLNDLRSEVLPKLESLVRDEHSLTQQAALRLYRIYCKSGAGFNEYETKQVFGAFLKGLDGQRDVRLEALRGLHDLFSTMPLELGDCDTSAAEEACRVLLIHLDDPDAEIAKKTLACLRRAQCYEILNQFIKAQKKSVGSKYSELVAV
ncbi:dynein axonemal assembly factor 5-like isoform X2 [Paramacrobiotus metropolitanus]|uniref:dynein axonemal assembly factor 5-like isoform X2 n=1 Tax=Paramacrobiotus metropolitanus TaxID=2943436 RepID=UPI0024456E25|nr:dynein axonemal assembly factor 5-like isoform X2 [Paramacrobiotus metropolitanus]